jgi:hypothetical protein
MATKELVTKQMQKLIRHHPQYKLTPELLDGYYEILDVCIPEYLTTAVTNILATSKYFPKPAEILQAHEIVMLETIEVRTGKGNANRIMTGEYGSFGRH